MICKHCNTEFDSSHPDANGIVVCPNCGVKYRKKQAPAAWPTAAPRPASSGADNPFKQFMNIKIGGKVPAWCAVLAGVVVVAVLLIILLSGSGQGSPEALVKKLEKAMNGDADALWDVMTPQDKKRTSFDEVKETMKSAMGQEGISDCSMEYISYEKDDSYDGGVYDEVGRVKFRVTYKNNGKEASSSDSIRICKLDGKWYMYSN